MKVYMLLDRSGSMAGLWSEALGAINGYVKELGDKETQVFLAAFDTQSPFQVLRETNVANWTNVSSEEVTPRGMTPLNDSTGKLLDKVFKDDPRKAMIVIMTDGYENSSIEYTTYAIKAKISIAKERGYEVVFLGANFKDIENLASEYGVASNRTMNITGQNMGSTMRGFATSTQSYNMASNSTEGAATMDAYFSDDTKKAAVSVDTGNMPPEKAKKIITELQEKYNKGKSI